MKKPPPSIVRTGSRWDQVGAFAACPEEPEFTEEHDQRKSRGAQITEVGTLRDAIRVLRALRVKFSADPQLFAAPALIHALT